MAAVPSGRIYNPGFAGSLDYEAFPWNTPPVITATHFYDFANFMEDDAGWNLVNQNWGSRGVHPLNARWSGDPAVVAAAGGSGGIVALRSLGNYAADPAVRRQGASLISRTAFGAGKFEVRMKVVPRFGPCTAAWTFFSNHATTGAAIEYSEIDIEAPGQGGGFLQWGGVSYEAFFADSESEPPGATVNGSRSVAAGVGYAYNDGRWHVFAFEWRTNRETGDVGVVWFHNGRIVGHTAAHVPVHTAQFWVGNWFPGTYPMQLPAQQWVNDWLGEANFDEAWMFVDWVRVTQYDDPTVYRPANLGGTVFPPLTADLGAAPLPRNNYVTNGRFTGRGGGVTGTGSDLTGWDLENAGITEAGVRIHGGGRMRQHISAQYGGFTFDLELGARPAGLSGEVRAFVEFWNYDYPRHFRGPARDGLNDGAVVEYGSNSTARLSPLGRRPAGRSQTLTLRGGRQSTGSLRFTVPEGAGVNNLYLVIEAGGRGGIVREAAMFLVSEPVFRGEK
jgi:hypothetical protein